jgi:hypothetical protein
VYHFVLDLGLGHSHQVSDSHLGVLVVERVDVGHLHVCDFSVESGQNGPGLMQNYIMKDFLASTKKYR